MKFCAYCGNEMDENSAFCVACGNPVMKNSVSDQKTKFCANCGKQIDINADVCIACGCSTKHINKNNRSTVFCTNCGKEISVNAAVCVNCGCAVSSMSAVQNATSFQNVVSELSKRVKINSIIWFCIAGLQIIVGLTYNWVLLIPGVLNIICACMDLKYSKDVLTNQTGVIKKYEPIVGPVITAVYNLIIGGVIGVAGSVYYFVAIRQFVLGNRQVFEELESAS